MKPEREVRNTVRYKAHFVLYVYSLTLVGYRLFVLVKPFEVVQKVVIFIGWRLAEANEN
jgi:hypothetical protein